MYIYIHTKATPSSYRQQMKYRFCYIRAHDFTHTMNGCLKVLYFFFSHLCRRIPCTRHDVYLYIHFCVRIERVAKLEFNWEGRQQQQLPRTKRRRRQQRRCLPPEQFSNPLTQQTHYSVFGISNGLFSAPLPRPRTAEHIPPCTRPVLNNRLIIVVHYLFLKRIFSRFSR